MCEDSPGLEQVISKGMWDYMSGSDKFTSNVMRTVWSRNVKKNLKKLYPKHGSLTESFFSFCRDKVLIGVGAGPSLKNNIDHLKELFYYNLKFSLDEQPFIIAASNHQYKPLLKMGIAPHFVFLTDGGDHIHDQLCTDIPNIGQATVLIASIYGNHKTIKAWVGQGRHVCFTIPGNDEYQQMFKDIIGEDPEPVTAGGGGNVLNSMFTTGMKILHSRYFIALGNDLSYPYDDNIDKRRNTFYADGDYSVNIKKGVDEAKDRYVWVGYTMRDNPFEKGKTIAEFKPVATSRQLFIYKAWIELHVTAWATTQPDPFIYYNCSEGGIAGVLARDTSSLELMHDPDNWYLMDEVVPKRWRTRTLLQAANQFLEASLICREKGANAIISPGRTDSVLSVGQNHKIIR